VAKVLLVVNDVAAAYELRRVLNFAGHAVFLEFDARDALALVERQRIDFIACDPVLPGTFGTDLIVAARATLRQPELPAVLFGPLPDALKYELYDAEPVQVISALYSGDELLAVLQQVGLGPRQEERRRFPSRPSLGHRRRSTDTPPTADGASERSKE